MVHNWLGAIFLLILVFLLVSNASQTVSVLGALGNQATALTGTLQGRSVSGAGGPTVGAPSTPAPLF